jgi:hypothetical protein
MTLKSAILWLAMVVGLSLMIWLLFMVWLQPPREVETKVKIHMLRIDKPPPSPPRWDVICPTWGPCWRDGKPIEGSL